MVLMEGGRKGGRQGHAALSLARSPLPPLGHKYYVHMRASELHSFHSIKSISFSLPPSIPPRAASATNYVVIPFSKSPRIALPAAVGRPRSPAVRAPAANPLRDCPRRRRQAKPRDGFMKETQSAGQSAVRLHLVRNMLTLFLSIKS